MVFNDMNISPIFLGPNYNFIRNFFKTIKAITINILLGKIAVENIGKKNKEGNDIGQVNFEIYVIVIFEVEKNDIADKNKKSI